MGSPTAKGKVSERAQHRKIECETYAEMVENLVDQYEELHLNKVGRALLEVGDGDGEEGRQQRPNEMIDGVSVLRV